MPSAPPARDRIAAKDGKRKTKSRNGCQRCKEKRLKCDETSPACLQCRKRNIPCPGYEKKLKWSTKYEVFQPAQRTTPIRSTVLPNAESVLPSTPTLTPEVLHSFEALAAVLPVSKSQSNFVDNRSSSPDEASSPPISHWGELSPTGYFPDTNSSPTQESFETIDLHAFDDFLTEELTFDQVDVGPFEPDANEIEEFERIYDETPQASSDGRLSQSLLLNYYRLPSPNTMSALQDMDSLLVHHYFKEVCALFSGFDSALNPFRGAVAKVFQDSPSIYYGIQSMAAAHLANRFPRMSSTGLELQHKAFRCLEDEIATANETNGQGNGKTLLSILLLGLSTSWHESRYLGQEFLTTARNLILPQLLSTSDRVEIQRSNQFFEESLIYWEMLMGFVSPDVTTPPVPKIRARAAHPSPASRTPDGKIVPHPWTGVAPMVLMMFAEVGRVVHRERMWIISGSMDPIAMDENEGFAAALEENLLEAEYPLAEAIADIGDEQTKKDHFVILAEAYRCAGLLEIYRVFPRILDRRLGTDRFSWSDKVDFEFPMPRFGTLHEETDKKLWISSLALHILNSLETLPSTSGTCCLQPILMVTAASELKYISSIDYFDVFANDARVLQARNFVGQRLSEYALRLPAKPLRRVIDLVKEVWRRFDSGEEVFWMDVMIENGWETLMG